MMLLIDPAAGCVIDANAAAVAFYGYPREEILGMPVEEINTLPREQVLEAIATIRKSGGSRFEFKHGLADGSFRNVEVCASLIQYGDREICHSIIHDITERNRAETAQRSRAFAEGHRRTTVPSVSSWGQTAGKSSKANTRACGRCWGFPRRNCRPAGFRLLHTVGGALQRFRTAISAASSMGLSSIEYPMRPQRRQHDLVLDIRDAAGSRHPRSRACLEPAGHHRFARAQTTVRQLSRAVQQTPTAVVITDLEGRITFVNQAFCRVTGYEEQEALGKNPRVLKSGKDAGSIYKDMWETIARGRSGAANFRTCGRTARSSGNRRSSAPLTDENGNVTHYLAVKEDITRAETGRGPNCRPTPWPWKPRSRHWRNRTARPREPPGQERVPGQHEPRDPHADERRDRHDRPAAGYRPRRRSSASIAEIVALQRRVAPDGDQRHPRLLQDRGRQARAGDARLRPATSSKTTAEMLAC